MRFVILKERYESSYPEADGRERRLLAELRRCQRPSRPGPNRISGTSRADSCRSRRSHIGQLRSIGEARPMTAADGTATVALDTASARCCRKQSERRLRGARLLHRRNRSFIDLAAERSG
jgi:hypothetical protein